VQDYGFRIYKPELGKFLSVDPLTQSYPWYTPYQFAGNKPIQYVDVDGLEEGMSIWQDNLVRGRVKGVITDKQLAASQNAIGVGGLIASATILTRGAILRYAPRIYNSLVRWGWIAYTTPAVMNETMASFWGAILDEEYPLPANSDNLVKTIRNGAKSTRALTDEGYTKLVEFVGAKSTINSSNCTEGTTALANSINGQLCRATGKIAKYGDAQYMEDVVTQYGGKISDIHVFEKGTGLNIWEQVSKHMENAEMGSHYLVTVYGKNAHMVHAYKTANGNIMFGEMSLKATDLPPDTFHFSEYAGAYARETKKVEVFKLPPNTRSNTDVVEPIK
jgi:hypothetical protein